MILKKKFVILVLDDCHEDLQTYQRFLERDRTNSYEIHPTYHAREALQFCETQWPDLIVLDFLLPDLNGIQFIDALEAIANGKPLPSILVMTGQGDEEVAVTFMKKGVQDYLIKNKVTETNFQQSVQRILDQVQLRRSLELQQKWQLAISKVSLNIRQSLDIDEILNTAVSEVKDVLSCDRAIIYQFEPNWAGSIVAESVSPPWRAALGENIIDTCFEKSKALMYAQGRKTAIDDIYKADLSECHIGLLEAFQVRASIIVPILLTLDRSVSLPKVWGLLIVHQCQNPRPWEDAEGLFLEQISVQLAIAIHQSELLQRLNQELAERSRAEQKLLNQTEIQGKLIQNLAKFTTLLEIRNRDLDTFVAFASHDLRAPLRGIKNLVIWVLEDLAGAINPDLQKKFDLMTSRVHGMEVLLNDLLQYAQIGRVESNPTTVCIEEILRDIINELEIPIDFKIHIAPEMPKLVADYRGLRQVFINLIENAVKHHTRSDGRVEIAATREGDFYRFDIKDDGPGILLQHQHNIFQIFRSFGNPDNRNNTGVGLAIVKKIIELQGGMITIESNGHSGTIFRFTVPLVYLDSTIEPI
jgi:signal transduction histidine kinase/CheY-like chemotaxis protein